MCWHRTSHQRPECRLPKTHEEKGWIVSKKDKGGGLRRFCQTGSGSRLAKTTELAVQTIAQAASVTAASVGRPSDMRGEKSGRKTRAPPLAKTCAQHVHAGNQSNTVTYLLNMQKVPSVLAVHHGVGHTTETPSRVEKSSQRPGVTFSPSVKAHALYVSAVNHNNEKKDHHQGVLSCDAKRQKHLGAFHASAMSGYPKYPTALNSSSKRVQVNARVNIHPAHNVTNDTATHVPCIPGSFVQTHPSTKDTEISAVPRGAINLSSADGSPS